MKITFACFDSVSIDHGGALVQVLETKRELESMDIAVSLFDRWKPFTPSDADLVHIFAARYSTFQMATTMHLLGVPFVTSSIFFTQHTAPVIRTALRLEKMLKYIRPGIWTDYGCTQQICGWSEAVLPNTQDEAALLRHGMGIPAKKISVIPNGVDGRFELADPGLFIKKYGMKDFVLNVGHIGPGRKNVLGLIRALASIDHPAVIIGRITDDAAGAACVAEAAKNKNILLIPGLPNDSELLASAYAACDTFVLPSLFETPGIAALEAGLAGAKIVITPHGGTRDYFGPMAHYVEPHSVESIRNGISAALSEDKTNVLREHIKREFLWSTVARKTAEIYRQVLSDRSNRS